MSAGEHHPNPFGVYVPGSRGHLPGFPAVPRDDHPLVPWAEEEHAGQWVDVDHVRQQLEEFRRCLDRLPEMIMPHVDRGHLVVVTGPVGMGKTTLIHQCIHLAHQYLADLDEQAHGTPAYEQGWRPPRPVVAMTGGYVNYGNDVSWDERGDFAETPGINAAIRDKIAEALRGYFPGVPFDPVIDGGDVHKAFSAISALLAQQNCLLFAIVPHIDWRDAGGEVRGKFLRTCLRHAQSRIVLFVEISHQHPHTAHEVVGDLLPFPEVTHLSLGSLTPEDPVKFTEAVRGGHPAVDDTPPPAPDVAWELLDVRQLRKECFEAAERQRRQGGRVRVTAADLRAPTLDPAALGRSTAPAPARPPGQRSAPQADRRPAPPPDRRSALPPSR
ncbi:ATP-binding protein [Streptomyces sp. NPDC057413]|uniref:ATP-binding protein n=1 Tax=Streptomyces sp. NPDC057413 TaxID=3346124 RepID=UPI0036A92E91